MKQLSRELIQSLRKQYPKGSHITLDYMNDPYHPVEPGTTGTLQHIDDAGTFHVAWHNGRTLGLIYGEDSFTITAPAPSVQQDTLSERLAAAEEKKPQLSSPESEKHVSGERSDDICL